MDRRSALFQRLLGVRNRGSGLVFHLDQVDGVGGDIAVTGDHHGYGVSDIVDAVLGKQVVMRDLQVRQGDSAWNRTEMVNILADKNGNDPWVLCSFLNIDSINLGRRVGAAQRCGIVHAGKLDILHIGGSAGDELGVLPPPDGFSHLSFGFLGYGCLHHLPSYLGCGGFHRIDDVLITRTAAQVSFQTFTDLFIGRLWVSL